MTIHFISDFDCFLYREHAHSTLYKSENLQKTFDKMILNARNQIQASGYYEHIRDQFITHLESGNKISIASCGLFPEFIHRFLQLLVGEKYAKQIKVFTPSQKEYSSSFNTPDRRMSPALKATLVQRAIKNADANEDCITVFGDDDIKNVNYINQKGIVDHAFCAQTYQLHGSEKSLEKEFATAEEKHHKKLQQENAKFTTKTLKYIYQAANYSANFFRQFCPRPSDQPQSEKQPPRIR